MPNATAIAATTTATATTTIQNPQAMQEPSCSPPFAAVQRDASAASGGIGADVPTPGHAWIRSPRRGASAPWTAQRFFAARDAARSRDWTPAWSVA